MEEKFILVRTEQEIENVLNIAYDTAYHYEELDPELAAFAEGFLTGIGWITDADTKEPNFD